MTKLDKIFILYLFEIIFLPQNFCVQASKIYRLMMKIS